MAAVSLSGPGTTKQKLNWTVLSGPRCPWFSVFELGEKKKNVCCSLFLAPFLTRKKKKYKASAASSVSAGPLWGPGWNIETGQEKVRVRRFYSRSDPGWSVYFLRWKGTRWLPHHPGFVVQLPHIYICFFIHPSPSTQTLVVAKVKSYHIVWHLSWL